MIFSIAVGLTSGNFGTLIRYKIPLMPFIIRHWQLFMCCGRNENVR
ncbi:MAG: hypothetical protein IPI46_14800 [Bacteroidetes bacterium]|nr:hypothetical protein [Bacteroidota bacterium]